MEGTLEALVALQELLTLHGEHEAAAWISEAIGASHEKGLQSVLSSRELWGGSGSIADQAGIAVNPNARAEIENTLIELARAIRRTGIDIQQAQGWADVFEKWREMRRTQSS